MENKNNKINYIEFYTTDIDKTKKFYEAAFGWTFTDYGPTYSSFSKAGIDGGFEHTDQAITNGVLVVLHHSNLEEIKKTILKECGKITKDIFSFPGGKRFQFTDPVGNELAVWCAE